MFFNTYLRLRNCRPRHSIRRAAARRGFTLMELMVVIVIIGLLAGAVTMGVRAYLVASKQNLAKMEIAKICDAVETFYITYGRYPTNEEGVEILTKPSDKLVAGLLSKVPVDPWEHAYQYNQPGRNNSAYEVICFGSDGREGGEGEERDISSTDLTVAKKGDST